MKRLLLVIMLIFGINIMSSGQLVKSSSISVTKKVKEETPKVKEKKAKVDIPVKTGFRQYVDYEILAFEFLPGVDYDLTTQIQYTAGYRFNEHFFLGGGAGIFIGFPSGCAYETFSRFDSPDEHQCYHSSTSDLLGDMPLRMLSFPLFVNARAYLLKSNIQPYASLSIGALLSGNATAEHRVSDSWTAEDGIALDYNCSRFFVNPALGVSFRLRSIDIHAAVSWRMSLNPVCFDQSIEHALANSIGFVVGVSF